MLDERYFSQFQSHRSQLVRAAMRMLGGAAEAEDAVQDTYLRALEAAADGRSGPDAAQAWLTTVMQNLAIDRLRRRHWMRDWLRDAEAQALAPDARSAEADAALAQETRRALRLLATQLGPADGASVLLREVFEASYAEIADACGKTEAGCRQQLHRALLRLRQHRHGNDSPPAERAGDEAESEALFRIYSQSLQNRDARPLFALVRQPVTRASAQATAGLAKAAPKAACRVAQVGGQLGLVLTLDGQFVCVLPLGARQEEERVGADG